MNLKESWISLCLSTGLLELWLIAMIVDRKWQSLSNFLTSNGWHEADFGWYTYEREVRC